jgi:hypothetical protein
MSITSDDFNMASAVPTTAGKLWVETIPNAAPFNFEAHR